MAQEFISDVIDHRDGGTYQEGIVDCATVSDFDQKLSRLESVWNAREKLFCGVSAPQFYQEHKADVVHYNRLRSIRQAVGLGSPPSIFTMNISESLNKVIKHHAHFKPSE